MTNYRVRTCRNNLLVKGHCNRCGRKRILLEHQEDYEKSKRRQKVARDHHWQRNPRPRKAMIERRKDHCTNEYAGCKKLYRLLAFFSLCSGTRFNSPFKELRIILP